MPIKSYTFDEPTTKRIYESVRYTERQQRPGAEALSGRFRIVERNPAIIRIRNTTGGARSLGDVLQIEAEAYPIDGPIFDSETPTPDVNERYLFDGIQPTGIGVPWCVLMADAADDEFAPAALAGIVLASVDRPTAYDFGTAVVLGPVASSYSLGFNPAGGCRQLGGGLANDNAGSVVVPVQLGLPCTPSLRVLTNGSIVKGGTAISGSVYSGGVDTGYDISGIESPYGDVSSGREVRIEWNQIDLVWEIGAAECD